MEISDRHVTLFWAKVDRKDGDGCWEWLASKKPRGYGQFGIWDGRKVVNLYAHRVAYELCVGPIPNGLQIDHICRNRACVNPSHLRAVSHLENHQNLGVRGRSDNRSSGWRGVSWDKVRQKWHVSTMYRGKQHFGGRFDELEDAVKAAKLLQERVRRGPG